MESKQLNNYLVLAKLDSRYIEFLRLLKDSEVVKSCGLAYVTLRKAKRGEFIAQDIAQSLVDHVDNIVRGVIEDD